MAFEIAPPGTIPDFADLETRANGKKHQIIDALDRELREHKGVLGSELKLSKTVSAYICTLANVYEAFGIYTPPAAKVENVTQAGKLGIILAHSILAPRFYNLSYDPILQCQEELARYEDVLYSAPLDYLEERTTLADLAERYTAGFVATPQDQYDAVAVCGLVLAQVDLHEFEQYITMKTRSLDEDLIKLQQGTDNPS